MVRAALEQLHRSYCLDWRVSPVPTKGCKISSSVNNGSDVESGFRGFIGSTGGEVLISGVSTFAILGLIASIFTPVQEETDAQPQDDSGYSPGPSILTM